MTAGNGGITDSNNSQFEYSIHHKIFSDFHESEYITTDKGDDTSHIVLTITWKHYPSRNVDKNGKPYMNTSIIDWEFMEED